MTELLNGVKVLDLSRVLAGLLCTMMLGDLGARVIKVQRPATGDETRGWGPPFDQRGESAYYLSVNRNKKSVAADLDNETDRAMILDLARGERRFARHECRPSRKPAADCRRNLSETGRAELARVDRDPRTQGSPVRSRQLRSRGVARRECLMPHRNCASVPGSVRFPQPRVDEQGDAIRRHKWRAFDPAHL